MKSNLIIPRDYKPLLNLKETEKAIRLIKDFFQINLSFELNLIRVTAPMFVKANTGVNADLNGVEKPVSFPIKALLQHQGRDCSFTGQVEAHDAGRLSLCQR